MTVKAYRRNCVVKYICSFYQSFKFKFVTTVPLAWIPQRLLYWAFEVRSYVIPSVSDSNPLDLRWVDPKLIKYQHSGEPYRYQKVYSYEWEMELIEDHPQYLILKRMFGNRSEQSGPNEMIEIFNKMSVRRDWDDYRKENRELFESMIEKGYKTQRDILLSKPISRRIVLYGNDTFHHSLNEISVSVTKNGEFSRGGSGFHRLAMAKILDVSKVPVVVRGRHKSWQSIRDEIRNSDSINDLSAKARNNIHHPDLMDINQRFVDS